MYFEENNGELICRDEYFDLKVGTDRVLYIRYFDEPEFKKMWAKHEENGKIVEVEQKTPFNLNMVNKRIFLDMLNDKIKMEKQTEIETRLDKQNSKVEESQEDNVDSKNN